MKRIRSIWIVMLLLSIHYSCIKEDRDLSDCYQKIIIEFDWSLVQQQQRVDEKVEVIITDEANHSSEMLIDREGAEVELMPDMYEFVGDETHENVILQRCTLTVRTGADGNYLEPAYFTGGSVEKEINLTDVVQIVTIPMRQQTRDLIIRVIFHGELLPYISGLDAVISGITMSREINDGFPPVDNVTVPPAYITSTVDYSFVQTEANLFTDRHTLLGIDGNSSQILNFSLHYNNGNNDRSLSIDVTDDMEGFHTVNIYEPWVLEFELGMGPESFTATIENWRAGPESVLIAH
ncbi:MAG: hypothetical protein LUG51_14610 [Tannerellaceae bacterium]|nr:hypothetical protein [Tannerellaceae bacterium]